MLNKIIKLFSKSKTTKLPEYFNMYSTPQKLDHLLNKI